MPQCKAKAKSTGVRCARSAIAGAVVCRVHGGATPAVKAAAADRVKEAQDRLYGLVNPAIDRLGKLIKTKREAVALGAVKDVLDRNGFKPKDTAEVGGKVELCWLDPLPPRAQLPAVPSPTDPDTLAGEVVRTEWLEPEPAKTGRKV